MDWEAFKKIVAKMFGRHADTNFQFLDEEIQFSLEKSICSFKKEEFDAILSNLSQCTISAASIYTSQKMETLIEPLELRYGYRFQENDISFADENISCSIATPSNEMVLAFLFSIPETELRSYRRIIPSHMMTSRSCQGKGYLPSI